MAKHLSEKPALLQEIAASFMRFILTTIILTMLAQPVWAKTVYHCETVAFASITEENSVDEIRSYRSKMAVLPEKVLFSGEDFLVFGFDDLRMSNDGGFHGKQHFAGDVIAIGNFSPPNLKVLLLRKSLLSFRAHCENF